MGEPLTDQKLNDMWRAGYCRKTVAFAQTTTDCPTDSRKRLEYLRTHSIACMDCFLANQLKLIEAQTAEAMGPTAALNFIKGGNITKLPHFREHFDRIFNHAKKTDPVWSTPYAQDWIMRMAQRGPYIQEEEHGQDSN